VHVLLYSYYNALKQHHIQLYSTEQMLLAVNQQAALFTAIISRCIYICPQVSSTWPGGETAWLISKKFGRQHHAKIQYGSMLKNDEKLVPRSLHWLATGENLQSRYYMSNTKAPRARTGRTFVCNIFDGMCTKQVESFFDFWVRP